jgi:hypothetical protein
VGDELLGRLSREAGIAFVAERPSERALRQVLDDPPGEDGSVT